MRSFTRILLTAALCLGVVLPKIGSAVQMLVLGELQTVVLCTGDGIITIRIDAEGNPIEEVSDEAEPCVLGNILITVVTPHTHWQALARSYVLTTGLREISSHVDPPYMRKRPARAPPILTV
ncbi:hypothetical protein [Aliiroseovarius sp. F20344]|uniref:hypothetical protein n=1 Tax=Aliiroseovarius sp. F20344 TaxID=2926414 RepID=UPI001FF0E00B|nr:hypothetical protein [Aliiroseovarius sp. F20344]MCK0142706.1 hypothetical protein [Aliiroseovarius sp. F20344]